VPFHRVDEAVRALVEGSASLHPDDVAHVIRQAAEDAGARDVELVVVDLAQQTLLPLLPADHRNAFPIDGSPAGLAYRHLRSVHVAVPDGVQLWVPLLDGAERIGALGITVAETDQDDASWATLGAVAGELITAKSRYGDGLALARRTRDTTLAAEMRWWTLPPLTFSSERIRISGILEPAYEIAGDTFDYALNGDLVHAAILDAMGHGLEASRMASVAVASYRHSRRTGDSLERTAMAIDEVVQTSFERSRYVTGQLATLQLSSRRLRVLNMGHPVPLLIRDRRVVGELDAAPMLPAGWGDKPAIVLETRLEQGDTILMYTDGIVEARNGDGTEFGIERFVEAVDRFLAVDDHLAEVLRSLIDEVLRYQDFHARDDATLLALQLPDAAPA
jgi:hypothetical protein